MILDLADDEAVLMDALLKYASIDQKPPTNAADLNLLATRVISMATIHAAPNEVMQRLAEKMAGIAEQVHQARPDILMLWSREEMRNDS